MDWAEMFFAEFIFQLRGYMEAGGMVMWPLAMLSFIMWLLILERLWLIGNLSRSPLAFERARNYLHNRQNPREAGESGVVALLIERFLASCSGDPVLDRRILGAAVVSVNRSLTDHLAVIGVLAAVAPLLGLLGTVTGMITTFDVMTVFGTGNAKAMAGGISEALITTETGLLVAIPGLYMKNFLERRAQNLAKRTAAAGLYLQRHLGEQDAQVQLFER